MIGISLADRYKGYRKREDAYSPPVAPYRSGSARLVGVLLIQVAISEMNINVVLGEAVAAANISQSSVVKRVSMIDDGC